MDKTIKKYKELLESKKELRNLISTNENRQYFLNIRKDKEIRYNISKILKDFDGDIDSSKIVVFKNFNTNRIEVLNNSIEPLVKNENLSSYIERLKTYNKFLVFVFDREYLLIDKITSIQNKYGKFVDSIDVVDLYNHLDKINKKIDDYVNLIKNDIQEITEKINHEHNQYENKQYENMNNFYHELEQVKFDEYEILRNETLKKLTVNKFKI